MVLHTLEDIHLLHHPSYWQSQLLHLVHQTPLYPYLTLGKIPDRPLLFLFCFYLSSLLLSRYSHYLLQLPYQRNYSWTRDRIISFWDELLIPENKSEFRLSFSGSIILKHNNESDPKNQYEIIPLYDIMDWDYIVQRDDIVESISEGNRDIIDEYLKDISTYIDSLKTNMKGVLEEFNCDHCGLFRDYNIPEYRYYLRILNVQDSIATAKITGKVGRFSYPEIGDKINLK